MDSDIVRNSIQIYEYRKGFRFAHKDIIEKIDGKKKHLYPITIQNDDSEEQKYSRFNFIRRQLKSSNNDVLYYDIFVSRDTLVEDEKNTFNHSICFTNTTKGYLIVSGMKFRDTLLKYLTFLLHGRHDVFNPVSLYRDLMEEFMKKILKYDGNTLYRPRFYFTTKYRKRHYNDYAVDKTNCASDDSEFKTMLNKCHYFDPIFLIQNITKIIYDESIKHLADKQSRLKINHMGRIYSSKSLTIDEWVLFVKKLLQWCA